MKTLLIIMTFLISTVFYLQLNTSNTKAFDVVNKDACINAPDSPPCRDVPTDDVISGKNGIIFKIINIISWIGGVAAVLIIILAGFKFITSGGNSEAVAGAKNTIIYAIIGLIVIVIAQSIVAFVIQKL